MEQTGQTPKIGRFRKGWELTKSSWHVLRLDKELTLLPLIGMILSIVVFIPLIIASIGIAFAEETTGGNEPNYTPVYWAVWAVTIYLMTLITNFVAGAVAHGAITRFRGGNPTLRGSLGAAWHKLRPLAAFSLLMATVGIVLQLIAERLPFGGRIAVWIVGAAWNIANVFAVPIIVMDENNVKPLQATRRSVAMIRQVWGEGAVAAFSLGIIGALTVLTYSVAISLASAAIGWLAVTLIGSTAGVVVIVATVTLLVLGFFGIILVFSVLESILKAALYYYATTGQAPTTFNRELLMASMTRKKARKVFA